MKKVCWLVSLFAMLLFAGLAVAQDAAEETDFFFEDEEGPVFYITLPDTWSGEWQEVEDMSVLHALPEDESLYISIVAVHDVENLEGAAEMVDKILAEVVTDYSFDKWEETTLNNIPFEMAESKAKMKDGGADTEVAVAFFAPKENNVYILYAVGSTEAQKAHEQEIQAIFGSIRTEE